MNREQGHYYVKFRDQWTVALLDPLGDDRPWKIAGHDTIFADSDFDEIGPHVPTQEELQRLHKTVEVSKAYCSHVKTDIYESTPQRGALIRSIDTSIPNHCEVCQKLLAFDDLLDACREALEDCKIDCWENSPLAKKLRTAIDKAEGKHQP